jgi:signal recognition particle subunit SRP54
MGDMLSLIERAEQVYDEEQAKKMEKKLRKGSFDFEDFLSAMQQMRKLGPLQQILAMIPGMGQMSRDEELVSEKDLKRIEAIIFSMTKQERRNPDLIKGRRKERIAKGSGTQLQDVTALVGQFKQMQRMMKKMAGGGRGLDPREMMRRMR